jgi:hypothetical protein
MSLTWADRKASALQGEITRISDISIEIRRMSGFLSQSKTSYNEKAGFDEKNIYSVHYLNIILSASAISAEISVLLLSSICLVRGFKR